MFLLRRGQRLPGRHPRRSGRVQAARHWTGACGPQGQRRERPAAGPSRGGDSGPERTRRGAGGRDRGSGPHQAELPVQGGAGPGAHLRRQRLQDKAHRDAPVTAGKGKRLKSDLGRSTADRIVVRGYDLVEDLIGKVSLGDMAFLELKGRLPTPPESTVFNALAVTLVEHGMTPSAIATRLTYFGAPESLQGAVAAGLLGIGDRFGGSVEEAARTLQEALAGSGAEVDLNELARKILATHKERKRPIAGLGHPIHKTIDQRNPKLFALASENGFSGRYVQLMKAISGEAG